MPTQTSQAHELQAQCKQQAAKGVGFSLLRGGLGQGLPESRTVAQRPRPTRHTPEAHRRERPTGRPRVQPHNMAPQQQLLQPPLNVLIQETASAHHHWINMPHR